MRGDAEYVPDRGRQDPAETQDRAVGKVAKKGVEGYQTGEMHGVDQPGAEGPDDGRAGGDA